MMGLRPIRLRIEYGSNPNIHSKLLITLSGIRR